MKWGVLMSFRIETRDHGGRTVYSLHDDATGASASVLPAYGFNLFDLRLPLAGELRPVLVASPDFADHPAHPAGNGTPILFPFPNRIRDGRFTFRRTHLPVARHQRPQRNSRLRHDRGLGRDRA